MTGIPYFNHPLFYEVEAQLQSMGIECWNPAREGQHLAPNNIESGKVEDLEKGFASYKHLLRLDIHAILAACNAIVLLDGWQQSNGARAEAMVAIAADLRFYRFHTNDRRLVEVDSIAMKSAAMVAFNTMARQIDALT